MLVENHLMQEVQSELSIVPEKISFKIGEMAHIMRVKTHVLRYWEDEFSLLKPKKFSNKQRLYFKKDVEILFLIKHLLYEKNFSIKGTQQNLPHYYRKLKEFKIAHQASHKTDQKLERKIRDLIKGIEKVKFKLESQLF